MCGQVTDCGWHTVGDYACGNFGEEFACWLILARFLPRVGYIYIVCILFENMYRLFIAICLLIMCSAFASVLDATTPRPETTIDGVRVERVVASAENCVFWRFANTNAHSVEVVCAVEDYPAVTLTLQAGEQRQIQSAYSEALECGVSVRRL